MKLNKQLRHAKNRCVRYFLAGGIILIPGLFSASTPFTKAVSAETLAEAEELERVRENIEKISSELDSARLRTEKLEKELKRTEIAIGHESLRLKQIEKDIRQRKHRLSELTHAIRDYRENLSRQRKQLARQVRSAYMAGRSNYLKLLLNQENPAMVGRVLAYYDYYNQARIESIIDVKEKLELINSTKAKIESETRDLAALKSSQLKKTRELNAYRESRKLVLEKLESDIESKDEELRKWREQEEKITKLLQELEQTEQGAVFIDDAPPFGSLKGELDWPTEGKLLNSFGSRRKATSLRWHGVKIGANSGEEVRAVHTGKVLFADWFRNLGLLMILDHGDGYMSLYGYNQSLLKKPGDWVLAGEIIAYTGNSGGQSSPGVYFEIRHNGKPLDPVLWCKR